MLQILRLISVVVIAALLTFNQQENLERIKSSFFLPANFLQRYFLYFSHTTSVLWKQAKGNLWSIFHNQNKINYFANMRKNC